jgi:transposase-like protein
MDLDRIGPNDERACYEALLALFHPHGLACPGCGARKDDWVRHRCDRDPVIDYRCSRCGRIFNAWTGTALEKTRLPPSALLGIVGGIVRQEAVSALAVRLGVSRTTATQWRGRLLQAIPHLLRRLRQGEAG